MSFITRWLSLVPLRRTAVTDKRSRKHAATGISAEPGTYRAVELRTRGPACKEARRLMGKRMLVSEAPPLPLEDCGVRCVCYYKPHADRRRPEPRRMADVGITSSFYIGPERRSGLDRRHDAGGHGGDDYYDYMRRRDGR